MRITRSAAVTSVLLASVLSGGTGSAVEYPDPYKMATICSTRWGWCPITYWAAAGAPCRCFLPPSTELPGTAIYFNYWAYYDRRVDPYLNPHWTDPPPPPRTIP